MKHSASSLFRLWVGIFAIPFLQESLIADDEVAEAGEWHPGLAKRIVSYEAVRNEARSPLFELQKAYLKRLEQIKLVSQQRGNLEEALLVEEEIQSIDSNEENEAGEGFSELDRARETFRNHADRLEGDLEPRLARIDATFAESLETFQAELTRDGKLEEAIEVKRYLEEFSNARDESEPIMIELFWLPDFQGESVKLEVPVEIPRFAFDDRVRNDVLSSIRIPEGVVVTISPTAELSSNRTKIYRDEDKIPTGTSSLRAELR